MNATAWSVLHDSDLVCYLVDASIGWSEDDEKFFSKLIKECQKPLVVVATKTDKVKMEIISGHIERMKDHMSALAPIDSNRLLTPSPFLVSAKRPEDLVRFKLFLAEHMPVGPWLYAEDDYTDRPQMFVCGELIREQIFRQMGQELPYSAAVKVERFENKAQMTVIQASIVVHKENHKGMLIGARGTRIKSIGQAARLSLERHLNRKVHLELFVKVLSNWIDSDDLLAEYAGLEVLEE